MRWRAEVSRLMVPVAAPAARRASWYWRIWYVVRALLHEDPLRVGWFGPYFS